MIDDPRLLKVDILIQQNNYVEAEKLLKDLLFEEPNNINLLAGLAEVKLQQDEEEEALKIIDSAIGISPDVPDLFYIKSRILLQSENYSEAEKTIKQAIELNAYDANYFALFASIQLSRKDYHVALASANNALSMDAENILALNIRSTALLKLNKKEESFKTIEGALREDPNNAFTHTNYGWGLLEKGDHKKALQHFKEALTKDPNFEFAQAGMLEAIKATNPMYRLFLKYAFWMGNLTAKYQWGVIVGFYIGFKMLRVVAKNNEGLEPYLMPIIFLLAFLAFSTWIITPISNLFLRFNKYGQLLLDKKQKMSSNFVALSLFIFILGLIIYFTTTNENFIPVIAFGFAMMVPCSVMFLPSKYKNSLLIYAIVMAMVGSLAIGTTFMTDEVFNVFSTIFLVGFIGFQWLANYLMISEDNR